MAEEDAPGGAQPATPRRHVVIGAEYVGRRPGRDDRAGAAAPPPAAPPAPPPPAVRPASAPLTRPRPSTPPARRNPTPAATRPPGGRARRARRIVLGALAALVAVVVGLFLFGWWQFSRIERVDVGSALSTSAGSGTNYLIVGTDSREGIDADAPDAGAFLGEAVSGSRTDTIMVLRADGDASALLSIPRDLWVRNPATGEMGRINSVYQSGPAALIEAVQSLGIPIDHYLEIDFVSFGRLVDSVGGISVEFAHPARDTHSGLDVPEAGTVTLDGSQALAYVRSRYYEELVDDAWRTDPTADLGRVERQRAFLSGLMSKITGTRNPISLVRLSSALGGGLRIDQELTYFDALGLAWSLRDGFTPESMTLPVTPRTTSGGAAVLDLQDAEAAPVRTRFGA